MREALHLPGGLATAVGGSYTGSRAADIGVSGHGRMFPGGLGITGGLHLTGGLGITGVLGGVVGGLGGTAGGLGGTGGGVGMTGVLGGVVGSSGAMGCGLGDGSPGVICGANDIEAIAPVPMKIATSANDTTATKPFTTIVHLLGGGRATMPL